MSLLTRKERSLGGLIVFAFPQDKDSFFEKHGTQRKRCAFSRSLRVFPTLRWCLAPYYRNDFTFTMGVWSGGSLTPGSGTAHCSSHRKWLRWGERYRAAPGSNLLKRIILF